MAELDQLNQEINYYRQESAIFESKNEKMTVKLQKMKKKNFALLAELQVRQSVLKVDKES